MTDRELLELAAKAAGIEIDKAFNPSFYNDTVIPFGTLVTLNDKGGHTLWNPLTDDGDALRLAVKLRIKFEVHPTHPFVAAFAPETVGRFEEHIANNTYEATRKAIVRAAAEIGKEMK